MSELAMIQLLRGTVVFYYLTRAGDALCIRPTGFDYFTTDKMKQNTIFTKVESCFFHSI